MVDTTIDYKAKASRIKKLPVKLVFQDGPFHYICKGNISSQAGLARFMERSIKKAAKYFKTGPGW